MLILIAHLLSSGSSRAEPPMAMETLLPTVILPGSGPSVVLPPWEEIVPIAELYLLYCDSQPLPLFHRGTFLATLQMREPEIIYAMLALSLRFSDAYPDINELIELVNGYAEVARGLVMKRIAEGPVELSTLQCLCLLSFVDFTSDYLPALVVIKPS